MFLKNCWYMAAWDYELVDHKLVARTLLNQPVLIYRGMSGEVHAMEDRCCHRGAALSDGRMEGDCIRCMYHGLKFDTAGQCIEIPGQARIPPDLRVKTYPVVAQGKFIWIWMGDPSRADQSKIPDIWYMHDPRWHGIPGYLHYDANYLLIADNLCDITHMAWVHTNTLCGSEAYAFESSEKGSFERLDNGFRATRWDMNRTPPPFVVKVSNDKPVDRWNTVTMTVPGIFSMESGFAPAGQGAENGNKEGAVVFQDCQFMTPETERTTHFFFDYLGSHSSDNNDVSLSLYNSLMEGFFEDKGIIEHQQVVLEADPNFKLRAIARDKGLAHFRWVMDKLVKEEQAEPQEQAAPRPQPQVVAV
ncbi:MAG: Rieske 2Fe-2S domain-containing protein [Rhodanobacteraceae bacterium]